MTCAVDLPDALDGLQPPCLRQRRELVVGQSLIARAALRKARTL